MRISDWSSDVCSSDLLVGEILDLFDNGMAIGITDISATCHMPDVIEEPYRPAMLDEGSDGMHTRLGGPSCLAGDVIGDYRLPGGARIGQRFALLDKAHYSMVKTNSFNGRSEERRVGKECGSKCRYWWTT